MGFVAYALRALDHVRRYQYDHVVANSATLFIEHPRGINACHRALEAPMAAQDVFASVSQHDRFVLEAAVKAFSAAALVGR